MLKEIETSSFPITETLDRSDFSSLSIASGVHRSTFGRTLARIRKRSGYSQRALDPISGVCHSTITRLENGERNPNISTIANLAEALKLKSDTLQTFQLIISLAREDDKAYINDIFNNRLPVYGLNNRVSEASTSVGKAMDYKKRRRRSSRQVAEIGGINHSSVSRFFKGERVDIMGFSFVSLVKGLGLTTRGQIMDLFYSFVQQK